jgi:predicted acyltransferase
MRALPGSMTDVEGQGSKGPPTGAVARSPVRLVSLDAFRGLVIVAMLLVNNLIWTPRTPRQLMHAPWGQGVTFTDMIFPWFILAMGVAIPFSAGAARERRQPRGRYLLRAGRRAAVLVILGWVVDSVVAHRPVLGMGVLQLLGLAYLAGVLAIQLPAVGRVLLAGTCLGGHWALIRFAPVPGAGSTALDADLNIIKYLNEVYLGPHLAGIISVVPTSALIILGTLAGEVLRPPALRGGRVAATLLGAGAALAAGGWLWQRDLPFNKPVWSASYILFAGGVGTVVLGLCYLAFDLARLHAVAYPFAVFGANAIVVYVASILFKVLVLQRVRPPLPHTPALSIQDAAVRYLSARFGVDLGGWLYTLAFIAFWWLVLLWLYRRRIFIRV